MLKAVGPTRIWIRFPQNSISKYSDLVGCSAKNVYQADPYFIHLSAEITLLLSKTACSIITLFNSGWSHFNSCLKEGNDTLIRQFNLLNVILHAIVHYFEYNVWCSSRALVTRNEEQPVCVH